MARQWMRDTAWAFAVVVAAVAVLGGCSGNEAPSSNASKAASAAESLASQASSAVASLASEASGTLASATAEAHRRLEEIKGGVDAKGDVKLGGSTGTDADGRKTVPVTVTNSTSQSRTYAVQVDFRDAGGNLLDTVVVTVDNVAAGASKDATARSNRKLTGDVTTSVARAVRY